MTGPLFLLIPSNARRIMETLTCGQGGLPAHMDVHLRARKLPGNAWNALLPGSGTKPGCKAAY